MNCWRGTPVDGPSMSACVPRVANVSGSGSSWVQGRARSEMPDSRVRRCGWWGGSKGRAEAAGVAKTSARVFSAPNEYHCATHAVVVDDLDDGRELASRGTVVDEDDAADLDEPLESLLRHGCLTGRVQRERRRGSACPSSERECEHLVDPSVSRFPLLLALRDHVQRVLLLLYTRLAPP